MLSSTLSRLFRDPRAAARIVKMCNQHGVYVIPAFEVNEAKFGPNKMRDLADSSVKIEKPAFLELVHSNIVMPFHIERYIPGQLATGECHDVNHM